MAGKALPVIVLSLVLAGCGGGSSAADTSSPTDTPSATVASTAAPSPTDSPTDTFTPAPPATSEPGAITSSQMSTPAAPAAASFSNCTEMHGQYPHGVGKPGAVDSTSGTPVTDFVQSQELYDANSGLDRDGDGIACEKH